MRRETCGPSSYSWRESVKIGRTDTGNGFAPAASDIDPADYHCEYERYAAENSGNAERIVDEGTGAYVSVRLPVCAADASTDASCAGNEHRLVFALAAVSWSDREVSEIAGDSKCSYGTCRT